MVADQHSDRSHLRDVVASTISVRSLIVGNRKVIHGSQSRRVAMELSLPYSCDLYLLVTYRLQRPAHDTSTPSDPIRVDGFRGSGIFDVQLCIKGWNFTLLVPVIAFWGNATINWAGHPPAWIFAYRGVS